MSSWTGCISTSDANPWNRSTNMSAEAALGVLCEGRVVLERDGFAPGGMDPPEHGEHDRDGFGGGLPASLVARVTRDFRSCRTSTGRVRLPMMRSPPQ